MPSCKNELDKNQRSQKKDYIYFKKKGEKEHQREHR